MIKHSSETMGAYVACSERAVHEEQLSSHRHILSVLGTMELDWHKRKLLWFTSKDVRNPKCKKSLKGIFNIYGWGDLLYKVLTHFIILSPSHGDLRWWAPLWDNHLGHKLYSSRSNTGLQECWNLYKKAARCWNGDRYNVRMTYCQYSVHSWVDRFHIIQRRRFWDKRAISIHNGIHELSRRRSSRISSRCGVPRGGFCAISWANMRLSGDPLGFLLEHWLLEGGKEPVAQWCLINNVRSPD